MSYRRNLLTTFNFDTATLPVHWEVHEIHGAGSCDGESGKLQIITVGFDDNLTAKYMPYLPTNKISNL